MKKMALVLMLLSISACNTPRAGVDSGANDAGSIVLPDGGPRDGGGGAPDTGGSTGGCTLTVAAGNFGTLSPGCLPRCSGATLTAINACPTTDDGTCLNAALDGDTTPGVAWSINGTAATTQLDCGGCFGNQQIHCLSAVGCGAEVDAYISCLNGAGMPACTAETTALNNCGAANQTAFGTCANSATMGVVACFSR